MLKHWNDSQKRCRPSVVDMWLSVIYRWSIGKVMTDYQWLTIGHIWTNTKPSYQPILNRHTTPILGRHLTNTWQVVIRSDSHREMNECMEKYLSIHSFSFSGPHILERQHWRQSKIIGIECLNCCLKMTTVHLGKTGLKMREWHFRELSS